MTSGVAALLVLRALLLHAAELVRATPESPGSKVTVALRLTRGPLSSEALDASGWTVAAHDTLGAPGVPGIREIAVARLAAGPAEGTAAARRPTRLEVAVETAAGVFVFGPFAVGELRGEAVGPIVTAVRGEELLVSTSLGLGSPDQTGESFRVCERYALVCRSPAPGVPTCTTPVQTSRAPDCQEPPRAGARPPAFGRGGQVVVDGRPFPLAQAPASPPRGPLASDWKKISASWSGHASRTFSQLPPVSAVALLADRQRRRQTGLAVDVAGRWFTLRFARDQSGDQPTVGSLGHTITGRTLLVTWSTGVGVVDPPDSTYVPCRHFLSVCRLVGGRPACSQPLVVDRAASCQVGAGTGLEEQLPRVRALSEDRFEIGPRRLEVKIAPP